LDLLILVLSIAFKGIAIPIYWQNLGKGGSSNTAERMYCVFKIVQLVGKNRISCILGDREFIGHEWFSWLAKSQIDFVIRIKSNTLVKRSQRDRLPTSASGLFRRLKLCGRKFLKKPFYLGDLPVYLTAGRSPKGELLIVATPKFNRKALKHYKKRREIENLFGCLKSKGFDLEATHMCDRRKSEKLLFVVVIAFCWSYLAGIKQELEKPIPLKTHRRKSRSLFRYGYDILRQALFQGMKVLAKYYYLLIPKTFENPRRKAYV
jgi:Transposase DDE domain